MDFEAWTTSGGDRLRRRRLAAGYALGASLIAGATTLVALTAKGVAPEVEEPTIIDVQLAKEPEPEPEPAEPDPRLEPSGPRLPKLRTPTEVPDDAPQEAEPVEDPNPYGEGDPYRLGGGGGGIVRARPTLAAAPPPPPPKPKPRGPMRVTEDVTPPSCDIPVPSYPSDAKSAGIEGTVFLKYTVTERGAVVDVRVVRGPEALHAASIAALRKTRCTPATLKATGQAVRVTRAARFPFRIR